MKKLYLSSYKFGRHPESLSALAAPGSRAAIVMNASDVFGDEKRASYVADNGAVLERLGFQFEELDLRDYFGSPDRLARDLGRFGLIWAVGGNAFVLRRAMRQSGFDVEAARRVSDGSLVYAGFSAGAVVAGSSLRSLEVVDPPDDVPTGYELEPIWEGLGFVPYTVAPHFQSEHPESPLIDDVVADLSKRGVAFRALRDGEAIVVHGDDERVVGSGIGD